MLIFFYTGTGIEWYFFVFISPGKQALDVTEFFIGAAFRFFGTLVAILAD